MQIAKQTLNQIFVARISGATVQIAKRFLNFFKVKLIRFKNFLHHVAAHNLPWKPLNQESFVRFFGASGANHKRILDSLAHIVLNASTIPDPTQSGTNNLT